MLCDEDTGSDGEAVTEGIRRLDIGKIIGTRTWGGEIWLAFAGRLSKCLNKGNSGVSKTYLCDAAKELTQCPSALPVRYLDHLDILLEAQYLYLECLPENRKNASSCCRGLSTC